jgi:hypothetical protein
VIAVTACHPSVTYKRIRNLRQEASMAMLHEAWLYVPAREHSDFASTAWPVLLFATVGVVLALLAMLGLDLSGSMYDTLS